MAITNVVFTDVTTGVLAAAKLYPTFNSMSVDLRFTSSGGHVDTNLSATIAYRATGSLVWLPGIRPWRCIPSGLLDKTFTAKIHNLLAGTSYDFIIVVTDSGTGETQEITGTQSTRVDNIPAASSLVPTHYISPTGSDATGTGAIGAPWQSMDKAVAAAGVNAIIRMAPGEYIGARFITPPGVIAGHLFTAGQQFIAQNPAVVEVPRVIGGIPRTRMEKANDGQRSYIVPRGRDHGPAIVAPTGTADADLQMAATRNEAGTVRTIAYNRIAPWVQVQFHGPVSGAVYTVWRIRTCPTQKVLSLTWHTTRAGAQQRVFVWDGTDVDINTPAKWAEAFFSSQAVHGMNGGAYFCNSAGTAYNRWDGVSAEVAETTDMWDVYLVLTGNERKADGTAVTSPNDLWWTFGGNVPSGNGSPTNENVIIHASNVRLSGVEIRSGYHGVRVDYPTDGVIIDHCYFHGHYMGLHTLSTLTTPPAFNTYMKNLVAQYNLFEDNGISSPWVYGALYRGAPWPWIKNTGATYTGTLTGNLTKAGNYQETSAIYFGGGPTCGVVRYNTFDGTFDGVDFIQDLTRYDRFNGFGCDFHDNLHYGHGDDGYDFANGSCISIWNSRFENCKSWFSIDANGWGPYFIFNNECLAMGDHMTFADASGVLFPGTYGGPGIKFGGTCDPWSEVWFVNNTFWAQRLSGSRRFDMATNAAGGNNPPFMRYFNNIVRTDSRLGYYGGGTPSDSTFYDGDYNAMASAGYDGPAYIFGGVAGAAHLTLAAWRTAVGKDLNSNPHGGAAHGVAGQAALDAHLVDPTKGDVRLLSGSVLATAGVVIPNLTPTSNVPIGTFYTPGWRLGHARRRTVRAR